MLSVITALDVHYQSPHGSRYDVSGQELVDRAAEILSFIIAIMMPLMLEICPFNGI